MKSLDECYVICQGYGKNTDKFAKRTERQEQYSKRNYILIHGQPEFRNRETYNLAEKTF